jgi:D-glycero-D-manno-heptose 1,7-bisphosphate phosphatase
LGFMDENTAYQLLKDMVVEATGYFPPVGSIVICPHGVNDGCNCRKPAPGMLQKIMRYWGCSPKDTLYVGDMESDRQAAINAGCDFQWASEFFGKVM